MNNSIDKPYSLHEVLESFSRVEIPVIQRDYAQGREDEDTGKIRKNILDYVLQPLTESGVAKLDFIYGYEKGLNDKPGGIFVPVDGQQRMTTLWLLYWLLALKTQRMPELLPLLEKFTYETRPSSKDFLECLCAKWASFDSQKPLRPQITEEAPWFINAWKLDASISGFINMLEAIERHEIIRTHDPNKLLHRLLEGAVRFYFLRLENFSLGEEIYTRLNARGKILNDFETFKSAFFKISGSYPKQHADLARKIESAWVDYLWPWLGEDFLVDSLMLNYILFIAKLLYLEKGLEIPASEAFSNFAVIEQVFDDEKNLDFLIHAFDNLPILKKLAPDVHFEWENEHGLEAELKDILFVSQIEKKAPVSEIYVFAALLFLQKYPPRGENIPNGLNDFLRITRNLLGNTPDRTLREWPGMLKALRGMIEGGRKTYDAYGVLSALPASSLTGFREEQRQAEKFKARLIGHDPGFKQILDEVDENVYIRGKIGNIAKLLSNKKDVSAITAQDFSVKELTDFFQAYESLEKYNDSKDFDGVWGDLLDTSMYDNDDYRCWYGGGCNEYETLEIQPALLELAKKCANGDIEDILLKREKEYVRKMIADYGDDLSVITNPKAQLYLLYIAWF